MKIMKNSHIDHVLQALARGEEWPLKHGHTLAQSELYEGCYDVLLNGVMVEVVGLQRAIQLINNASE